MDKQRILSINGESMNVIPTILLVIALGLICILIFIEFYLLILSPKYRIETTIEFGTLMYYPQYKKKWYGEWLPIIIEYSTSGYSSFTNAEKVCVIHKVNKDGQTHTIV